MAGVFLDTLFIYELYRIFCIRLLFQELMNFKFRLYSKSYTWRLKGHLMTELRCQQETIGVNEIRW